jgi:hypothetical protein
MGDAISRVEWPTAMPYQAPPDDGKPHVWAQKGFRFHDLLDIVNPLQHLPVISTLYRWITGDTIGNLPRIVGDAIYGGIPGFVSGLVGVLVKEETGKDVGEHVVATLFGDSKSDAPAAETAQQPELTTEQAAALTHAPIEVTSLAPMPADAEAAAPPTPATSPPTPAAQVTPATAPPAPTIARPVPAVAAAPVQPDHAPIPLVRGLGMSVAAPAATASKNPAADAFLALAAERQRQALGAAAPAGPGRVLSAQPVPLQLPPGSVALASRPRSTLASVPTSPLAAVAPASGGPVDISQKMLDALDKYVALHKQNSALRDARGTQVDVSP